MEVVTLKNVQKKYILGKTEVHALRGLNLVVNKGDICILKGHSGSGKSTTLNIIGGMDLPTSGEVHIAGHDISRLNDYQLSMMRRKHIGFIFQSFNLIPVLNALENVAYPLHLQKVTHAKQKAKEALKRVGLGDYLHHRPNELSGGQIQRVAIARGIVAEPDIILADEPTANLDSKTSLQILELMLELNKEQGLTFVVSTHHQMMMESATKTIELVDGEVCFMN